MGRKIRLLWDNDGTAIYFRVQIHLDPIKQFAAVGFVPRGASPKIETDLVKIYYNSTSQRYMAVDHFMAKNLGCDFANGLCRDESEGARNDIEYR